jgi:hypothetical protein
VSYSVEVLDEVKNLDMPQLLAIDARLARVVAELVRELYSDPRLGREMPQRLRLEVLKDCRKVPFDLPSRKDKPRFRLVYRNDPSDGSVAVVTVLAVGPRSDLEAYRRAASRLGHKERQQTRP